MSTQRIGRLLVGMCLGLLVAGCGTTFRGPTGEDPAAVAAAVSTLPAALRAHSIASNDDPVDLVERGSLVVFGGEVEPRVVAAAKALSIPLDVIFIAVVRLPQQNGSEDHFVQLAWQMTQTASDLDLAFVIAHEYFHLTSRHHSARFVAAYQNVVAECLECPLPEDTLGAAFKGMNDPKLAPSSLMHAHEFAADAWAVRRLLASGYSIPTARSLFGKGLTGPSPDFASVSITHPSTLARIAAIDRILAEVRAEAGQP